MESLSREKKPYQKKDTPLRENLNISKISYKAKLI